MALMDILVSGCGSLRVRLVIDLPNIVIVIIAFPCRLSSPDIILFFITLTATDKMYISLSCCETYENSTK